MTLQERPVISEKRIDFHSHIIPEMDDGSSSVDMSLRMIQALKEQGAGHIVLTPHFYPSRDDPGHFLAKRKAKLDMLRQALGEDASELIPGAEVHYFEGITEMQDLPKMRIGNTPCLMIEMPVCEWSERMFMSVQDLNRRKEYVIILAHAERYLRYGNLRMIRRFSGTGVVIQISCDAFSGFFRSREALKLLDEGLADVLGTDCHNMTSRPPDLAEAYDFILRKRGEKAVEKITEKGHRLLSLRADDGPAGNN